jgi:hypothetical protein
MIKIRPNPHAPNITNKIKTEIEKLTHPENYALSLQLDYRDNHTIFYLKKVEEIIFSKDWLEIKQKNNSHAFFDYNCILEYSVINAEDVIDLGVI